MLSLQFLKQFLPQQVQLHVITGKSTEYNERSGSSAEDVKNFLRGELSENRWQKLSVESQKHLISAEILWLKSYREFGFGINDCSGLITNLCKVIEKELVDRLTVFYFSEPYRNYVKHAYKTEIKDEPTMGWLVKLLNDFDKLSPDLQQSIEDASVMIHIMLTVFRTGS